MEKTPASVVQADFLPSVKIKLEKENLLVIFNSFFQKSSLWTLKHDYIETKSFFQINQEVDRIYFFVHRTVETKRTFNSSSFTEEVVVIRDFSADFARKKILESEFLEKTFRDLKCIQSAYLCRSLDWIYKREGKKILITGCNIEFSYIQPEV